MECKHHWLIEKAYYPTSLGKCLYCGEVREFYNSFPGGMPTGYVPDSLTTGKRGKKLIKKGEQR